MKYLISTEIEIPDDRLPKGPLSKSTEELRNLACAIATKFTINGATVTDVRVTRMNGPVES